MVASLTVAFTFSWIVSIGLSLERFTQFLKTDSFLMFRYFKNSKTGCEIKEEGFEGVTRWYGKLYRNSQAKRCLHRLIHTLKHIQSYT